MLVIDEISMLRDDIFVLISDVLKLVRKNDLPFGGIQLIVIGDFCQLPPVSTDNQKHFCFLTELWNECNFEKIVLNKVYRQKDKEFIEILNKLRFANNQQETINIASFLKGNIIMSANRTSEEKQTLHIFAHNKRVTLHNKKRLNDLSTQTFNFKSDDYIANIEYVDNKKTLVRTDIKISKNDKNHLDTEMRAEELLTLKVGCRVMLIYNLDVSNGLVNGALGTVLGFQEQEHENIKIEYIQVKFDNKKAGIRLIPRFEFETQYDTAQSLIRKQFPLVLAYAITIHKVQGLTLSQAIVDISGCWETGQAYVALSRVQTKENLKILNSINPNKFFADINAIEISK